MHLQDRHFALIRDDKCDTYKKLRDAAFALAEAEKQVEMFAPPAPPSAQDLKRHATMEEGVERTLAYLCQNPISPKSWKQFRILQDAARLFSQRLKELPRPKKKMGVWDL